MNRPDKFIFMKVGAHAGETWDMILARKREEFRRANMSFWGYGGPTCHPLTQVQPFVKNIVEVGGRVNLLMTTMDSKADPDIVPATEYSEDGVKWKPIPDGIVVTGSRYAVVLGEIQDVDLDVPLDNYAVALGPGRGRVASKYIRGRVDKACLEVGSAIETPTYVTHITHSAEILKPYAVLLRGGK